MKRISRKLEKRTIGIYEIRQLSTGKRYIGQSSCIEIRIYHHIYQLKNNKHHCKALQEAWNNSTPNDFKHSILQTFTEIGNYDAYEQRYMDQTLDGMMFNSHPTAGGVATGFKMSIDSRKKMSESSKIWANDPIYRAINSERAKKRFASGDFGYNSWSDERKSSMAEELRKTIFYNDFQNGSFSKEKIEIQQNIKQFYDKWVEDGSLGYKAYSSILGVPRVIIRPFIKAFQKEGFIL